MRVLMTADAVGGVWTYALDLSAALAEHDISVVLATMGPRPNAAQRAAVQRPANAARMPASSLKVPSPFNTLPKGRLREPGMWPLTMPGRISSTDMNDGLATGAAAQRQSSNAARLRFMV